MKEENLEKQILVCVEWLKEQIFIDALNTRHNSQRYAEIVSSWSDIDICEEAFLKAVAILELPFKKTPFMDKTIWLYLSEKRLRLYWDRVRVNSRRNQRVAIPALKRVIEE